MNAVASATEAVVMGSVVNPDNVIAPPLITRNATPSALLTVFEDSVLQPPSTKSKIAMRGFIPKSGFLIKIRNTYVRSGTVDEKQIAKEVKARRDWVFWHFDKTGKNRGKGGDDGAM